MAEGRGERLREVSQFPEAIIVIGEPNFSLSTAKIYEEWDRTKKKTKNEISRILGALAKGNLGEICSYLDNALEAVVFADYPQVKEIKKTSLDTGALGALMSGSGPSVFSIAETHEKALRIYQALKDVCSPVITTSSKKRIEIV